MTALLFIIPTLAWIALTVFVFKLDICLKEMGLQIALSVVVVFAIFMAGSASQTHDTMIVNGQITELNPIRKDCDQTWDRTQDPFCTNQQTKQVRDYPDSCSTDSKGKKTCTPRYHTEYRSYYPWERRYFVESTVGDWEITRVDHQGVNTPPRFSSINLGDPASASKSYVNYIRGASDTLFSEGEPTDEVPLAYPKVVDYYNINRVIVYGTSIPSATLALLDQRLDKINSDLAPKGVNVVLAVTGEGKEFATKLARAWDSHNLNDVVVTLGVDESLTVRWVDIRSWSKNEMVNIVLRDELVSRIAFPTDQESVDSFGTAVYNAINNNFELQTMENFEYLADDIAPPTWAYVLALIFLLIATPALTYFFHHHDFFGLSRGYRRF